MHYSSALVLGTLAAGSAAAAHNGRHASFHARRQAESKRDAQDVDWSKVSYDLSGVNWSSVFASPEATPTPSAQVQAAAVKQSKAASSAPATSAAATPTPTASKSTPSQAASSAAAPSQSSSAGSGSSGDYSSGVKEFFSGLGAKWGDADWSSYINQKSGNIYIGDSSAWKAKFVNGGGEDMYFSCWEKNKGGSYSGMSIESNAPAIAAKLGSGEELVVSFQANVPAACAPLTSSTKFALFGGVDNTWWEVTFGSTGAFDVSRNVNMKGSTISSKGSKCTSDMDTCVFKCQDSSLASCETGYDLYSCTAANGGGGGADANQGGATGGGCAMGSSGETVTVTF